MKVLTYVEECQVIAKRNSATFSPSSHIFRGVLLNESDVRTVVPACESFKAALSVSSLQPSLSHCLITSARAGSGQCSQLTLDLVSNPHFMVPRLVRPMSSPVL